MSEASIPLRRLHPWMGPRRLLGDDRLAQLAAEGDERAFARIYERHHQGLYRYCRSILRNDEDAADALQNTMVKALRALRGESRSIALKPWLYRIAHNEAISLTRNPHRPEPLDASAVSPAPGPQQALESREAVRTMLADIAQLSDQQRSALMMKEVSGLGYAEIATALDLSHGAARMTVHKARLALVQQSEGRDMECDAVRRKISELDGRVLAARRVRSHLRACDGCREFRASVFDHSHQLQALAPVVAAPVAAQILGSILGSGKQTAGGGIGALASGGSSAVGGSFVAQAVAVGVATVAVGGAFVGLQDAMPGIDGKESTVAPALAVEAETSDGGQADPANHRVQGDGSNGGDKGAAKPGGGSASHGNNGTVGAPHGTGPDAGPGHADAGGAQGGEASVPGTGGPSTTSGPPASPPSSDTGLSTAENFVPGGLPPEADAGAGHGAPSTPSPPVTPPGPAGWGPPDGVPAPPGP